VQDGRHSPYDRVIYLKNRDYIIEKISLPERKKGLIGECPFPALSETYVVHLTASFGSQTEF
jgi:hypothetical protein